jgi:uncharacterized protein (DUF111 family)
MRADQIGYGAGTRLLPLPNLLRVSIGETLDEGDGYEHDVVTLVETNIDDMNPQYYEYVMDRLMAAGALDVFMTPIQMKRNRPGTKLSVLAAQDRIGSVLDILFTETTAIGVRTCTMQRWKLSREPIVVQTPYGPIGVKVCRLGDRVVNVAPEYRDCRQAAERHGVALKVVGHVAAAAARAQLATVAG